MTRLRSWASDDIDDLLLAAVQSDDGFLPGFAGLQHVNPGRGVENFVPGDRRGCTGGVRAGKVFSAADVEGLTVNGGSEPDGDVRRRRSVAFQEHEVRIVFGLRHLP